MGSKIRTRSILEVEIGEAWNDLVGFDKHIFDSIGVYIFIKNGIKA